jgi:hypothetical protein
MLTELDALIADEQVPPQAWRIAGLPRDEAVVTLADCSVPQLEAFASIQAKTPGGRCFVSRARQVRDILYRIAGETPA